MNNFGLISIIVPIYNTEDYIEKCVKSIQNQTYKNIEIILVNDGSTDGSADIINKLLENDSRIQVIHKQNEGVTAARLEGIKKSSGNYIGFVDSDDVVAADMYEILLNNMIKYNADISHCGYQMIFLDGKINRFYGTGCIKEQSCELGQIDLLEGKMVEPGLCNKLYRKELFDGMNMDQSIKINEDLLMNFYLFKKSNKSVFYDVCKYHYIVRRESATRSNLNKHKIYDPIIVKKIIMENTDFPIRNCAKMAFMRTCLNICNTLVVENGKEYYQDYIAVRKEIIDHKKWIKLLTKKQRFLVYLLLLIPNKYGYIYRFYHNHLLKSLYS